MVLHLKKTLNIQLKTKSQNRADLVGDFFVVLENGVFWGGIVKDSFETVFTQNTPFSCIYSPPVASGKVQKVLLTRTPCVTG